MSHSYFEGAELDRIDNDGGYSPENCKWSTREENANNKRDNVFYTVDGIKGTVGYHVKRLGLNLATINSRIYKGWSIDKALYTKIKSSTPPRHELNGELYTLKELSELSGVSTKLLRKRINERGWTVERAIINESFKGNNKPT